MTPKKLAQTVIRAANDRKADDVSVLSVTHLTTLADYYIICTGTSNTHIRAIADSIDEALSKQGIEPKSREGYRSGTWLLMDYGSVIVHIFKGETRDFYALERLWGDARRIDPDKFLESDGDSDELL